MNPTALLPRVTLTRRVQHQVPLLFPPFFPFATEEVLRLHDGTPTARCLMRQSQSQEAKDGCLRKTARSRNFVDSKRETPRPSSLLPDAHSEQTAAPRRELTSLRPFVSTSLSWTRCDWLSSVFLWYRNTNSVKRDYSLSCSTRVSSGQTGNNHSPSADWSVLSYGTSVMKRNLKTSERRYCCAANESATISDRERKKDICSHESVLAETGDPQAICNLSSSAEEEDTRTVSVEEEGNSALSGKESATDTDMTFSSQRTKDPPHPVTRSESLHCQDTKPMRLIRVNRPGSARKSDISDDSSSDVNTCSSLRQRHEQEGTSVERGEDAGKTNESKLTQERDRAKEENVRNAKNVKQGVPASSGRRLIHEQEEFGFKYKGPEPTTHGDWAHNGRVTDF